MLIEEHIRVSREPEVDLFTVPRGRAVLIDQAGHMAHIDQPELWLGAVGAFLDRDRD